MFWCLLRCKKYMDVKSGNYTKSIYRTVASLFTYFRYRRDHLGLITRLYTVKREFWKDKNLWYAYLDLIHDPPEDHAVDTLSASICGFFDFFGKIFVYSIYTDLSNQRHEYSLIIFSLTLKNKLVRTLRWDIEKSETCYSVHTREHIYMKNRF